MHRGEKQGKEWSPFLIQPLGQSLFPCDSRDGGSEIDGGFFRVCEILPQRLSLPDQLPGVVQKKEEALLSVLQRLKTLKQLNTAALAQILIVAPSAGAMLRLL